MPKRPSKKSTGQGSPGKRKTNKFLPGLSIFLVVCALALYIYLQLVPASLMQRVDTSGDFARSDHAEKEIIAKTDEQVEATKMPDKPLTEKDQPYQIIVKEDESSSSIDFQEDSLIGQKVPVKDPVSQAVDQLDLFFSHLDRQEYMKAFNLPHGSRTHFIQLLQRLADNPPVVARETDDLFTLLQNTAHFFRILGKQDITVLKGILDREKEYVEELLQIFFLLTEDPEMLHKELGLHVTPEVISDYAAFFLNTMGGRLYLFRRDSSSRMAVTYYAIRVLDRALDKGDGSHGIDLRPAISSLIEELENGGNRLEHRDLYLDSLYRLEEKYMG